MINVLVVEDSPVVRDFLIHVLSSDVALQVIGAAGDGEEAVRAARDRRPDVITMDIHMPKMDGFAATRQIMETFPVPIVIVSGSSTTNEIATTFRALEAGALAVVRRPAAIGHPEHESTSKELIQTVRLMAEVKVVKRWPRSSGDISLPSAAKLEMGRLSARPEIVAIGASTGGPVVLETILSMLPRDFSVPILIVQHMATGFVEGFVKWLTASSRLPVHMAAHGDRLQAGHVYVAPDGFHMGVQADGRILLTREEPENGLRPSVSHLFRSVARVYGQNAVGVLLTGMGEDGAEELRRMRQLGAVTIAQDEESSVVYGMPGKATRIGAATYILPPEKIADALITVAKNR